ncbi:hypothetical protein H5410_021660 [Solanum commersonii]|uniref:Uncharacterized protein n=1 Tax=Solanum commersonii TaxID=4109 RepID=A0A9J5ZBM3_SOLCO|nr:hypothetical protein H5410_021660 [Solanum commersonii]
MLQTDQSNAKIEAKIQENNNNIYNTSSASCDHETETRRDHKSISEGNNASIFWYQVTIHRRNHSQEAENSHIKRGIKGFVKFQRLSKLLVPKADIGVQSWSAKRLNLGYY